MTKFFLFFLVFLSSCSLIPGRDSEEMNVKIFVSQKVNPDINIIPSIIPIKIFSVFSKDQFDSKDSIALFSGKKEALQAGRLVAEFELEPGAEKEISFDKTKDQWLVIIAGFRKIDRAEWKKYVDLSHENIKSIYYYLDQDTIHISTY